jgi:hypothetical protein
LGSSSNFSFAFPMYVRPAAGTILYHARSCLIPPIPDVQNLLRFLSADSPIRRRGRRRAWAATSSCRRNTSRRHRRRRTPSRSSRK